MKWIEEALDVLEWAVKKNGVVFSNYKSAMTFKINEFGTSLLEALNYKKTFGRSTKGNEILKQLESLETNENSSDLNISYR